jgi:hypothetical protein
MDFLVLDLALLSLLILLRKKNYSLLVMFGIIDFLNHITYRLIKPNIALKKDWLQLQKQDIRANLKKIALNYATCKKHSKLINNDNDYCSINAYSKSLE